MNKFIGELQEQNEQLTLENDRLRAVVDVDKVKAELIAPYANRVFCFLVAYCVCVLAILIMHGFKFKDFNMEQPVLSIIAGSTAVSAIGLVGIVVRGLFGPSRGKPDRPSSEILPKAPIRRRT